MCCYLRLGFMVIVTLNIVTNENVTALIVMLRIIEIMSIFMIFIAKLIGGYY